jgi:hypothetical protein
MRSLAAVALTLAAAAPAGAAEQKVNLRANTPAARTAIRTGVDVIAGLLDGHPSRLGRCTNDGRTVRCPVIIVGKHQRCTLVGIAVRDRSDPDPATYLVTIDKLHCHSL